MQGGKSHRGHRRLVLAGRSLEQLVHERPQRRPSGRSLGQSHQRVQGFPPIAHRPPHLGSILGPAEGAQHITHGLEQGLAGGPDDSALEHHQRLLHLLLLEEPGATAKLEAHSCVGESRLERCRLYVDAEEDRDILRSGAGRDRCGHLCRDRACLGDLARVARHRRQSLPCRLRHAGQRAKSERTGTPAHQLVRHANDRRARSVVLLETHDRRLAESCREAEQEVRGCSGERVDRLASVADHTEILSVSKPQVEQRLLQRRDILVFINDEEAVLLAHLLGDPRFGLDHAGRGEKHVFEVELPALILHRFVGTMKRDHLFSVEG